jgi:Family of unknown function (DUF6062)
MSEKFVGFVRLVEACGQPGCPVCHCVKTSSRQYLDALLYEQVTDPDTRRRLRASWGFCNWHAWMLVEVRDAAFGAAIIYEDMIRLLLARVRRLGRRPLATRLASWFTAQSRRAHMAIVELYRRRLICPACEQAGQAEVRYLHAMVELVDDAELAAAYACSDGLCAPHTIRAIELCPGHPGLATLVSRTVAKWSRLREELESFEAKHDYRNTEPFTDSEATSYRRAFELLGGAPGLFGNDLHINVDEMPRRRRRTSVRANGRPG